MKRKLLLIISIIVLSAAGKGHAQTDYKNTVPATIPGIDSNKFATLYIYRKNKPTAINNWYDLLMDDLDSRGRQIKIIRNNSIYSIRLYREGPTTFWAHVETRSAVTINVNFGKVYYLRCSIGTGITNPRPKLEFVPNDEGKFEYDEVMKSSN